MRPGPRHGFVLLFSLSALIVVTALTYSMLNISTPDREIQKTQMLQQLARTTAASGIEFAMAFINRRLSDQQGPWFSANYNRQYVANGLAAWTYSPLAFVNGCTTPVPNGSIPGFETCNEFQTKILMSTGEGNGTGPRWQTRFWLSMWPTFNYSNVRIRTTEGKPTLFRIRSRGEVLIDDERRVIGGGARTFPIAQATIVQTFSIIQAPKFSGCPTAQGPRATRILWELEPGEGAEDNDQVEKNQLQREIH